MRKDKFIIILILILIISAKSDVSDFVKIPSAEYSFKDIDLQNAILTTDITGRQAFALEDLTYKGKSNPMITDIVLSFNCPFSDLRKDDTEKYNIQKASYRFIDSHDALGGGAAAFLNKDHFIEIEPSKNLWLGSCGDLGSFTLEFRIYPISLNDCILFSRVGYFSGKKNGIEIRIKDGRIIASLYRIFKDPNGMRYNVNLLKGGTLEIKNWYHFVLSFDRISGKLAKYINGFEDELVYVTENDEPFEGVYEPSFECIDMPTAVIGKEYKGYMDEFRISYQYVDNLKKETDIAYKNYKKLRYLNRIPVNQVGIITSPVYDFPSTGTSVTLLKWSELLLENTFIWMEFRISDSLFTKDDNILKWYRISNNQKNIFLMKNADEYLRGKYYQWRAYLIPSPNGENSPLFYNIELTYRLDPPPGVPLFVEISSAGDKYVILKWSKNVEHDILGYRIYYGVQSNIYDGIISYINGERITNDFNRNRKYIEVRITNDIIEENKEKDVNSVLEYPLLDNTVLYFFSVSAYDSYKPDTPYNHESSLSKEVKARPFAGSEIKL